MSTSRNAPHALDNVVWSALTSQHAGLAEGNALARRYRTEFARFAALAEPSAQCFEALAQVLPDGEDAGLVTLGDVSPGAAFEVLARRDIVQMVGWEVGRRAGAPFASPDLVTLGPDDVDAMRALVDKTQPGPFSTRTHELGRFLGVRVGERLAAMTGERMRLSGFTEVSAVCTDPDFRGRGYARDLIMAVAAGIVARVEIPFLHVYSDNRPAIALYEKLGFTIRTPVRLTLLRKLPAG